MPVDQPTLVIDPMGRPWRVQQWAYAIVWGEDASASDTRFFPVVRNDLDYPFILEEFPLEVFYLDETPLIRSRDAKKYYEAYDKYLMETDPSKRSNFTLECYLQKLDDFGVTVVDYD